MDIAKVEPITTTRALRGPFDYRLPEGMADVGVGSLLMVPFANRRMLGVVVGLASESDLPAERLAERSRRSGRDARGSGRPSGSGSPSATARRPRAAWRSSSRRARERGSREPRGR